MYQSIKIIFKIFYYNDICRILYIEIYSSLNLQAMLVLRRQNNV